MISEFFLNIVFNIVTGLFEAAPDVTWSVDTGFFGYVNDFLSIAGYLLPMGTVVAIVDLIIVITIFKVFIALGHTIWDLLPFA